MLCNTSAFYSIVGNEVLAHLFFSFCWVGLTYWLTLIGGLGDSDARYISSIMSIV